MKTRKNYGYLVVVLLMVLVMVIACAPKPAPTPTPVPAAPTPTPVSAAPITLEYFSGWAEGEPYVPLFKKIIADFEKEHPNIKINVTWAGRENITKVRPLILTGKVPDIIDQGADELLGAFYEEGLLSPLTDALETKAYGSDVKWKDTFKPGLLDVYKMGDDYYVIPFWVDTTGFYYDGRMFSKEGLTPPKTWDEFLALCETLKGKGIPPLCQDGGIDFYNAYYFIHSTVRLLGPGGFNAAAGDKTGAKWDDPAYLQAAKMIEELVKKGYFIEGFEGYTWPAGQIDWVNGKGAMILISSWVVAETKDKAPEGFEYRFFPVPIVPGGKGKATEAEVFMWCFSVPKDAPHKEEAIEFIKFWLQKKYVDEMATGHDAIMSIKGAASPPDNRDADEWLASATKAFRMNDGVNTDYPEWWKKVFLPLDDKLIFGQLSAEEFIAELKKASIEYWKTK